MCKSDFFSHFNKHKQVRNINIKLLMVTDMSYFGLNEDRGPPSQRGHKSVQVQ